MVTHVLVGVKPIGYSLYYVVSIQNTREGKKTTEQDTRVMLETITIKVNTKYRKFMSMSLTKLNVASFLICTWINLMLQVAEYAIYQIDLYDTSRRNWYDLTLSNLT